MKHYTSIEQSKKLLELGLNPKSADMAHIIKRNDCREPWELAAEKPGNVYTGLKDSVAMCLSDYAIPCWSLGALLDVMPKEVNIPYTEEGFEDCSPRRCWPYLESCTWSDSYLWHGGLVDDAECHEPLFRSNDAFEVVYNTILWLLENAYIKGNKQTEL